MTELEHELRAIGSAIAFPDTPDMAPAVRRSLSSPHPVSRRRRVVLGVAIAVAVALVAGLAVPRARTAILRLLGVGQVRIEFVERLPDQRPAAPLDLGPEIDPDDAPFDLLRSDLLGDPDRVYHRASAVTLLYGTPEHVRLLVTEIAASGFTPEVGKRLQAAGTTVAFVPVDGAVGPGVWITGKAHSVQLPGGPPRLASNTLIWVRGGVTLRLEGAGTLARALEIAETME